MISYPVIKGGYGYLCPVSSAHGSRGHIKGVAPVVVREGREDELGWIGGVRENAVREAILATFTEIALNTILFKGSGSKFDDGLGRSALGTCGAFLAEILEHGG